MRYVHTAASIVAVLCLQAHAGGWNVRDAGAVGDGTQDNTAVFQRVLDEAAAAGGGIVHVPAGHYRFDGVLRIPGAVTLQGVFRAPPTDQREDRVDLDGSVMLVYAGRDAPDGEAFITLAGSMATISGLLFHYPDWRKQDVPPIPYPPTVKAEHVANVAVLDCLFLNAYEAIHFQHAGRFLVRNVYGYPSYRGFYTDFCLDIGRVENVHFWPFGGFYDMDDPYCKWINLNGVAFEFARTDWQYVLNTFCFGYGVGYKFSDAGHGGANGNFVGLGADSCRRAVLVEQAQYPGLLITNGQFVGRWGSTDSVGVEILPSVGDTKVSLVNCSFWGPLDKCIWQRSAQAQLTASSSHFCDWDNTGRGAAAVRLDAGRAILQGNTFRDGNVHIRIAEQVVSAIIMGNQAEGGVEVDNAAGDRTQRVANETFSLNWPDTALQQYRLDIGTVGDRPFISHWHSCEGAHPWEDEDVTKRWSYPEALLKLPVQPGVRYRVALDLHMPEYALDPDNALYLGDERLCDLPREAGFHVVTTELPAQEADTVTLLLRVREWQPADHIPDNIDRRRLGAAVRSVQMRARDADEELPCFVANTGQWAE